MKYLGRFVIPHEFTHQDHGITRELFDLWREPRFGVTNPTDLTNPVWVWLVKKKLHPDQIVREMLSDEEWENRFDGTPKPEKLTWCACRDQMTLTTLPDQTKIIIGGQNEDSFIPGGIVSYNDVIVIRPSGEISIYGYPENVFPLTYWHTATLFQDKIVIIGNSKYNIIKNGNYNFVYILNILTWEIERVETGGEVPPLIAHHEAKLDEGGGALLIRGGEFDRGPDLPSVANIDVWSLDLATYTWKNLTKRKWIRWEFRRKDGKRNFIKDLVDCFAEKKQPLVTDPVWRWKYDYDEKFLNNYEKICQGLGYRVDLEEVPKLFEPSSVDFEKIDKYFFSDTIKSFMIYGIEVYFDLNTFDGIQMTMEGEIPQDKAVALVNEFRLKLSAIEKTEWFAEEIVFP